MDARLAKKAPGSPKQDAEGCKASRAGRKKLNNTIILTIYIHAYILSYMKTVKVFKSGNSQAVRIPREYQVNGKEFFINKIGSTIILFPMEDPWKLFKNSLDEFSDDFFADGRKQPAMQKRRSF